MFLFLVSAVSLMIAVILADSRFFVAAIALFFCAIIWEHLKEKARARSRRNKSDATQYDRVKKPSSDELKQAHGYADAYLQGHSEGYSEGRNNGYYEGYGEGRGQGYNEGYGKGFSEGYEAGHYERAGKQREDFSGKERSTSFDPWQVLEISPDSSQQEIHKAFREQSKLYHPDLVAHLGRHLREEAETRSKDINRAYDMLKTR